MQTIMGTIQTMMVCGTMLGLAFFILLSMPQSQLRAFLLPIVGWAVAIACGIWCISPIDLIPDVLFPIGFADDAAALVTGITAAGVAMKAGRS